MTETHADLHLLIDYYRDRCMRLQSDLDMKAAQVLALRAELKALRNQLKEEENGKDEIDGTASGGRPL